MGKTKKKMFVKNGKNYIKKMFVKKWKKPKNGKKLVVIGLLKNGKIVKNKTKTKKWEKLKKKNVC